MSSQFIRLQGVVANGAKFSPLVDPHTAREIQFPRLSDTTIEVCVVYPTAQAVTTGSAPTLTIAAPGPTPMAMLRKIGTFSSGKATFVIDSSDTQRFCAGRLVFDVWLTVGSRKYQIVAPGTVRLTPNVTIAP